MYYKHANKTKDYLFLAFVDDFFKICFRCLSCEVQHNFSIVKRATSRTKNSRCVYTVMIIIALFLKTS